MPVDTRAHVLIQRYLDHLASAADIAELDRRIVGDPDVARAFARAARTASLIDGWFADRAAAGGIPAEPGAGPEAPARARGGAEAATGAPAGILRPAGVRRLAWAAVLLAAVGAGWLAGGRLLTRGADGTITEDGGPTAPPAVARGDGSTGSHAPEAPPFGIQGARGDVFVLGPSGESPSRNDTGLPEGRGLRTSGPGAAAIVAFRDGTRIVLGTDTVVRSVSEGGPPAGATGGKRLVLEKGVVTAAVEKQPPGLPLVVTTPHAEAVVVGTAFTLSVDGRATRLDVATGVVRLIRAPDRRAVEVRAGQSAVAGAGLDLQAVPAGGSVPPAPGSGADPR